MINKKNLNFSSVEIFLILSYLICWFSISTSFNDLLNFIEKENNNLNDLSNFLRQFFNLTIFPILVTIFLTKYHNINFRNEFLFIFASLYFVFQIPGLFLTNNSISNITYVISALNILLIFILTNIYFDKKKYHIFFIVSFLMLFLISILNFKAYINFFTSEPSSTLYTFFFSNETFLGKQSPRSTGSSRSLLLIMIISYIIFTKFFHEKKIVKIIVYIFLSTFILLFQSRNTITLLIVFILIDFIYSKKFSLKDIIKFFFFYLLFPILLLYSILIAKQFFHNKNLINQINKDGIEKTLFNITDDFKRPIDPKTYTSGRLNDWKNILLKIDKSIVYGYGSQGDRFLINQTASNGIIYAISSSGILGIIPFIFFSFFSLLIVIKKFFKNLKIKDTISHYSSIVVLLLLLRSILESSYAVFSIDFIVIYTFINYLNKFSLKNYDRN